MLVLSDRLINEMKEHIYKVYVKRVLREGCECFKSRFKCNEKLCIYKVKAKNLVYNEGRLFYTEGLEDSSDWYPAQLININNFFEPVSGKKKKTCTSVLSKDKGKVIDSDRYIVDVSGMSSFKGINEELIVSEYKLFITLFKNYSVKECLYNRQDLCDATFTSTKYDLTDKLQNSDFLKSKDFVIINNRRSEEENIPVGLIIKTDGNDYSLEYGTVYINMNNILYIKWN